MSRAVGDNKGRPPLVSVVIPTCNRYEALALCLRALTLQTYPNFEVVVVDDFSHDGSWDFLQVFAADHSNFMLRSLRNDQHLGANPSRNRGVLASRGEFVAFLDSDCVADARWLERLMTGFVSDCVGAVTGQVVDQPPENVYELTFKGTHRVHRAGRAYRLVAGSMCVRRDLMLRHRFDEDRAQPVQDRNGRPDVSVSGRGDEEGLYLRLKATGYEVRCVPDAIVHHEHSLDGRTFFRQAFRGGQSAARLVHKYYLPHRLDMLPFMLAYVTLPLVLLGNWLMAVPVFFFAGALAAITYNDLIRKGKTPGETIRTFPLLLAYYHLRLCGYMTELLQLRLGRRRIRRVRLDHIQRDLVKPVDAGQDVVLGTGAP